MTNEIIEIAVGSSKEDLSIVLISEEVPSYIRREMKEAGMFDEMDENSYINPNSLSVVLDKKYYDESFCSFISMLNLAIKKRYDDDVFRVIENFYDYEGIMKIILDSNVPVYVSKVINMPLELCERLLKGDDDVDGRIKDFVLDEANCSDYLEYVIVRSKNMFGFNCNNVSSHLAQIEIVKSGNREQILQLLERRSLCKEAQKLLVKTGNFEYISKLLDLKTNYFGILSPIDLSYDVQKLVVKTGNPKLILKLFNQQFLSGKVKSMIIQTGNLECILKLLNRKDLREEDCLEIAKTGNEEGILKLLERKKLGYEIQKVIISHGNQKQLLKLFYRDDLYLWLKEEIRHIFRKNGWKLPEA